MIAGYQMAVKNKAGVITAADTCRNHARRRKRIESI
jgi:hypothetical protein